MTIPTRTERHLIEAKEAKRSQVEQWRDAARYADVQALGCTWQADATSQDLLNKAISLAVLGLPLPSVWRDADNVDMPVTAINELLAIAAAMALQTQTAYATSWIIKAQLEAAATMEEVEAIVWTA